MPGVGDPPPQAVGARRGRVVATLIGVLVAALLVSVGVAVTIGPADLDLPTVWAVIADHLGFGPSGVPVLRDHIVWQLRLPRVLTAAVVGAGLAIVGAVMQTLTRNPLADPYLLGVSSGASLGAVGVIVLGLGSGVWALSAGAFAGALGVFALVIVVSSRRAQLAPTRMVLAGIAIGQLCAAVTSFVIIWVADPHATQEITFWLSGSLARSGWTPLAYAGGVLAAVLLVFTAHARTLNAFAFGDDAAATLGVQVTRTRWLLLTCAALLTGSLVAVSGAIGFVGLILPHAVRFLTGPDHRYVLAVAVLVGAIFLVWVDTAARTVFDPREVPVGVLTAILGVPAFVLLLRRREVRG
ncbi:FecCD family ABC transporter permease [Micromonospora sp. NBC_01813]|uniref:FecCD family ABC transporter permease n=1 Tax=Micromonospora sp. NBC_01813 TaxID=2975988 RepID=UPI002DDB4A85|nr:iron chelate uptake ABC transporter family permease subunit [Micromonospora sp. NBC_01813]WSA10135.1 iron chelate uptake ABC transporter family permease subunit [Micromonospora sp. NBC_01813]